MTKEYRNTDSQSQKEKYRVFGKVAVFESTMTPQRREALSTAGELYRGYVEDRFIGPVKDSVVREVATKLIQEANGDVARDPNLHLEAKRLLNRAPNQNRF